MGSVGTVSRPDEFGGIFGQRSSMDAIERLTRVNDYNLVNPNYSQSELYKTNCALCATAVALQARGYNVEAMPRDKDKWRDFSNVFDVDYSNTDNYILNGSRQGMNGVPSRQVVETQYKVNSLDIPTMPRGADKVAQAIVDKATKWGNGSVAVLNVKWANTNSGHAINIINQNGNVFGYDAQTNKIINDLPKYLKRTVANHTTLVRVDNAKIKDNIRNLDKMLKKSNRFNN